MLRGRRLTTLFLIVVLLNPSRIDSDRTPGTRGKLFPLASKLHAFMCIKGLKKIYLFDFKWFLSDKIFHIGPDSRPNLINTEFNA